MFSTNLELRWHFGHLREEILSELSNYFLSPSSISFSVYFLDEENYFKMNWNKSKFPEHVLTLTLYGGRENSREVSLNKIIKQT